MVVRFSGAAPALPRRAVSGGAQLCAMLLGCFAFVACSFDSEPVRTRTGGTAGTSFASGGSGQNGGDAGSAGSGGKPADRDASTIDGSTASDAGRDSGASDAGDAGKPVDSGVPDAGDGGRPTITCIPNFPRSCYSGEPATRAVGVCKAGTHRCMPDGSGFGRGVTEPGRLQQRPRRRLQRRRQRRLSRRRRLRVRAGRAEGVLHRTGAVQGRRQLQPRRDHLQRAGHGLERVQRRRLHPVRQRLL